MNVKKFTCLQLAVDIAITHLLENCWKHLRVDSGSIALQLKQGLKQPETQHSICMKQHPLHNLWKDFLQIELEFIFRLHTMN